MIFSKNGRHPQDSNGDVHHGFSRLRIVVFDRGGIARQLGKLFLHKPFWISRGKIVANLTRYPSYRQTCVHSPGVRGGNELFDPRALCMEDPRPTTQSESPDRTPAVSRCALLLAWITLDEPRSHNPRDAPASNNNETIWRGL